MTGPTLQARNFSSPHRVWRGRNIRGAGFKGTKAKHRGSAQRTAATAENEVVDNKLSQAGSSCGFQLNERYLKWDDSAQRRLIKIYVAQKLDTTVEWVDERLMELSILLPDLVFKLDRLKADLVLALVADTPAMAAKLVEFRAVLPELDLSAVLAQYPRLLLDLDAPALRAQLAALRAALPGVRVEQLVEREPLLLTTEIHAVLNELRRILPTGSDPVKVLLSDPSMVLDMKAAGLPASLEIDDGIKP